MGTFLSCQSLLTCGLHAASEEAGCQVFVHTANICRSNSGQRCCVWVTSITSFYALLLLFFSSVLNLFGHWVDKIRQWEGKSWDPQNIIWHLSKNWLKVHLFISELVKLYIFIWIVFATLLLRSVLTQPPSLCLKQPKSRLSDKQGYVCILFSFQLLPSHQ